MHQYKTVAQILLILSIFNLVFAIPVEREIYDAHVNVVVPVVVRNVAAMSKERRQGIDGTPSVSSPPPPDGSAPSHSSPPPPDVSPSDGPAPSHSSPPPPDVSPSDGPAPSHSSPPPPDVSPSDGPAPLHESPSPHPGGPAALAVSSPPGGTASLPFAPASDQPVPVHSTSTSQPYMAVTHDMLDPDREAEMKRAGRLAKVIVVSGIIIFITGGLLWHHRHSLRRRTIDPDCSMAKGSRHLCLDNELKDRLQD